MGSTNSHYLRRKLKIESQVSMCWLSVRIFLYFCRIPGDLQQVVFNVAAQSDEDWAVLLRMYEQVSSDAEKRKMIRGLASTQNVLNIAW